MKLKGIDALVYLLFTTIVGLAFRRLEVPIPADRCCVKNL